jgi:hypothetical protein
MTDHFIRAVDPAPALISNRNTDQILSAIETRIQVTRLRHTHRATVGVAAAVATAVIVALATTLSIGQLTSPTPTAIAWQFERGTAVHVLTPAGLATLSASSSHGPPRYHFLAAPSIGDAPTSAIALRVQWRGGLLGPARRLARVFGLTGATVRVFRGGDVVRVRALRGESLVVRDAQGIVEWSFVGRALAPSHTTKPRSMVQDSTAAGAILEQLRSPDMWYGRRLVFTAGGQQWLTYPIVVRGLLTELGATFHFSRAGHLLTAQGALISARSVLRVTTSSPSAAVHALSSTRYCASSLDVGQQPINVTIDSSRIVLLTFISTDKLTLLLPGWRLTGSERRGDEQGPFAADVAAISLRLNGQGCTPG